MWVYVFGVKIQKFICSKALNLQGDNKQIGPLCVFLLRNDAIFTTWEFSDVL